MSVPLPNLDDRRWSDLVEEGRALIPLYSQSWTDHNAHDPGITLMELFAWVTEMDIYQLNRIPDLHKRKFLQLVGLSPEPPRPARVVLHFDRTDGGSDLLLPATSEFLGADAAATATDFRTLQDVTVAAAKLQAIQSGDAAGFRDLSDPWKRGESLAVFGVEPAPQAALYLGFSETFPVHDPVSLYFRFDGPRSDAAERQRLLEEARAQRRCHALPPDGCRGDAGAELERASGTIDLPPHHGARIVWEFLAEVAGDRRWLPAAAEDATRSFTLSGAVRARISTPMTKAAIGRVQTPLFYLRCRLAAGAYDATPMVRDVGMNAVEAEQSIPVWKRWQIAPNASVSGTPPKPGKRVSLKLAIDEAGAITALRFSARVAEAPAFRVLDYQPPPKNGSLTLEAIRVGIGTGDPYQLFHLPEAPVDAPTFALFSQENGRWRTWQAKNDLTSSRGDDPHLLLEPTTGTVAFGDGEQGRVPPPGALMLAAYNTTRAESGALAAGTVQTLADSAHNLALLGDVGAVRSRLAGIGNAMSAEGGAGGETLTHTIARAIQLREARLRAVTLGDYESLARETPGVTLARVTAKANLHPSFPCVRAPGLITVFVLPYLPASRPSPTPGFRRAVASYLQRRRILGTRVEVAGPDYLALRIRARVRALDGTSRKQLEQKVVTALTDFLHPLRGGPDGNGWPFGRDVYRSEIMQVIDDVPGVDHVLSLALIADGCEPQCGNVCLGPTFLVASGEHEIEIV